MIFVFPQYVRVCSCPSVSSVPAEAPGHRPSLSAPPAGVALDGQTLATNNAGSVWHAALFSRGMRQFGCDLTPSIQKLCPTARPY